MGIYSVPTQNSIQKQLDATLSAGVTSLTLNEDVSALFSGVSSTNPGMLVVDRVDSSGNVTANKREYISFTGVSAATLTGLTRNADASGSDQEHAVGAIVEFVPDVKWAVSIKNTFETEHNADGTHSATYVVTPDGTTTLTNKTLTSPKIGTNILDTNGNELLILTATSSAVNELTLANGATGNNPTITASGETNVGLDLKTKGTGRFRKPTIIGIQVLDASSNTAVGDAKAYFRVPEELNGMNLVGVAMTVYTAGTTGTTDVQIRNKTDSVDMLSTKLTIDSTETDSSTAATPAVIDTTKDDVVTGDVLAIDIDAISTTAAKGLYVELRFSLP